jgi:hypothetical protein
VVIHQTLHGYARGHQLLAQSGPLAPEQAILLDRLSDLSGYLPRGEVFDHYHTGFPCGAVYAFAATWLDVGAERAGTVLTHTLLIPREELSAWSLEALTRHHRRPASSVDRAAYQEPLDLRADPEPGGLVALGSSELLGLFYAQTARPILRVSEGPRLGEIADLWRLVWPEHRHGLAFCTYALGVRRLPDRLFDILMLPEAAQASFHEYATSAVWWRDGTLPQAATESRWFRDLAADAPAALADLRAWAMEHQLSIPRPPDVAVLARFRELEAAAQVRLPAARARADLLSRLKSDSGSTRALESEVLAALLARLPEAALEPQPLWELTDLLGRPQVVKLLGENPDLRGRVEALARAEIARRVSDRPALVGPGLSKLWATWPASLSRAPLLDGLAEGISRVEGPPHSLVSSIIQLEDPQALAAVLKVLRPAARRDVAREAVTSWPGAALAVVEVAHAEGDVGLAFEAQGLVAATNVAAAHGNWLELEMVAAQTPPEARLEWAMDANGPGAAEAARIVARLDGRSRPVEEWGRIAHARRNGPRLIVEVARLGFGAPDVLKEDAELAFQVLLLWLQDDAPAWLGRAAIAQLPQERFLDPVLRAHMRGMGPAEQDVVRRVGPDLLANLIATRDQEAEGWLGVPAVQAWITSTFSTSWSRRELPKAQPAQATLQVWLDVLREVQGSEIEVGGWCAPLLFDGLLHADRSVLEAVQGELEGWLAAAANWSAGPALASEILAAVRRCWSDAPDALIVGAFRLMYPPLVNGQDRLFWGTSWWAGSPWDRARHWRHWLLDLWLAERRSAASLAPLLLQERDLARKVTKRAAHLPGAEWLLVELSLRL